MLRVGVGIAVSIVVLIMIAGDVYRFIHVDDGIQYFAEKPVRLMWVALIALVGGLATLVIVRLSPTCNAG